MADSWKMKCIDPMGSDQNYVIGNIYEIKNGKFVDEQIQAFDEIYLSSFEYFKTLTRAEWELVTEEQEQKYGSWIMRCVDLRNTDDLYSTEKIYVIKDGEFLDKELKEYWNRKFTSFEDFQEYTSAKFKLMSVEQEEPEEVQPPDAINPSHYKDSCSLECIEAMEMAYGKYWVYVFCITNAWKYIWRYKNKNGEQDIKKARWYVDKAKDLEEGEGELENIESVLTKIEDEKLWW